MGNPKETCVNSRRGVAHPRRMQRLPSGSNSHTALFHNALGAEMLTRAADTRGFVLSYCSLDLTCLLTTLTMNDLLLTMLFGMLKTIV